MGCGAAGRSRRPRIFPTLRPAGDQCVGFVSVPDTRRRRVEPDIVAQILAAHCLQQAMPVLLDGKVHRDIAVIGRIDVDRDAAVAGIAGARRHFPGLPKGFKLRGQGCVGGLLHRDLDLAAPSGPLALEQRRDRRRVEMDAGEEIDDRRAGFERRTIRKAGDANQPAHRLDRQIHRQRIAVRTRQAESGARGINEMRIDAAQTS